MGDTVVNKWDSLVFHTSLISDRQLLARLPTKGSKDNTETKLFQPRGNPEEDHFSLMWGFGACYNSLVSDWRRTGTKKDIP